MTKTQLKQVTKLTDNNNHTEALLYICNHMNLPFHMNRLQHIEALHKLDGSMDINLQNYRSQIHYDMLVDIEERHGKEVAQEINKCL